MFCPRGATKSPIHHDQITAKQLHEQISVLTGAQGPKYKAALMRTLKEQRNERFALLGDDRARALQRLAADYSDVLVVDGMSGRVVDGYKFDIELEPNAQPVQHQLPQMTLREMVKEQHHITKTKQLGHLRVPTDKKKRMEYQHACGIQKG